MGTDGITETKITEKGKKVVNSVPQAAVQGDTRKKPTARKSTTTSPRDKLAIPQAQQVNHIVAADKEANVTVIPDGIALTKVPAKPAVVSHILSSSDESALRKSKIMEAIRINKMGLSNPTNP